LKLLLESLFKARVIGGKSEQKARSISFVFEDAFNNCG